MCDTMVTMTDDGVLFAKNSDRDPNESQHVRWMPAADHLVGSDLECTWITIPQVAHTNALVVSQPWWMWGAEMGANEHGVVVGNQAVFTRGRVEATGLLGMDFVRLALERASTATAAVEVMIELLEYHGQGGSCSHEHPGFRYHNSFLVADPDGAMVLETAGRHWATEVVTGRGRSISNGLTIDGFARAHADPLRGRVAQCALRQAQTASAVQTTRGIGDLFATLRGHGASTSPVWSPINGALGAPCAHAGGLATSTQTTASWVSDLRGVPLHWATATSAPCTSLFKPIRVDDPVDLGDHADPNNHFDAGVRWWRHELLHRLVLRDHAASVARMCEARHRTEAGWIHDPPDTARAFATADALEDAWLRELTTADLPDRRPRWLRAVWSRLDHAAGVPAAGHPLLGSTAAVDQLEQAQPESTGPEPAGSEPAQLEPDRPVTAADSEAVA